MKKFLSVILALCFILTISSCGKKGDSKTNTGASETNSENFVKPEQYASVLLVTINPQFRLYLNENGQVLAVEAVNKDAETIKSNITFENQSFETVIENIVTEANKNGFIKEDATIKFEIVESKQNDEAKSDILEKARKKADDTANELKIEIKVDVGEIKTDSDTTTSKPAETQSTPETAHTHNFAAATCTAPKKCSCGATEGTALGHNYINGVCTRCNAKDPNYKPQTHTHSFTAATCTAPKKCSCGATEGTALGHNFINGVCTRCNAKDPNYKPLTSVLTKQGKWTLKYLNQNELYSTELTVCNSGEKTAEVGIGDPLSSLPTDMQNDPNIKNYCEVYNGEYYYIGRGDGDIIKTVTEENNTVTLTDSSNNKLVLARTGENTLKCTSASASFARINGIPVGSVFTFVAG